jgi:hypothetical protein
MFLWCDSGQIMIKLFKWFLLFGALLTGPAYTQDTTPPGSTPSAGQASAVQMTHTPEMTAMVNMHGMHTIPATVTHADPKTGIVDVMADGMALKVHFPPDSMTHLKAGDKIGLYMAYSQATMVH